MSIYGQSPRGVEHASQPGALEERKYIGNYNIMSISSFIHLLVFIILL